MTRAVPVTAPTNPTADLIRSVAVLAQLPHGAALVAAVLHGQPLNRQEKQR